MPKQLPITYYGLEILRVESKPVTDINGKTINFIEDMFYTMHNADGIGLAAPQVNSDLQIALIDISIIDEYRKVKPLALINPEILDARGEIVINEGCLSLPALRGDVSRPEKINLKYLDLNGKEIIREFDGFIARVIQHEIDHLHGKLFIDYLSEEDLKKNKSLIKKIKNRKVDTDYPLFDPKSILKVK